MNAYSLPVLTIWEPFKIQSSVTTYMVGDKFHRDFTVPEHLKDFLRQKFKEYAV